MMDIVPNETELNQLSRKQREAIPHLLGARSFEEGRKKAQVGKATLYAWLKDGAFKKELNQAREGMTNEAVSRLKASITLAVDGLIGLMETSEEDSVRLRACVATLDFFLKVKEVDDFEARLSALERAILEKRGGK